MNNSSSANLVILGSSGFAREVAWLVHDINKQHKPLWNIIGFWEGDDRETTPYQVINGIPLISLKEIKKYLPDLFAIAAIGNPSIRQRAVLQAKELGCKFPVLIHPSVHLDQETTTIGEGAIICAGTILTVNIEIKKHVIVNLNCTIGHNCILEDFVTLSPGCHLSGYTEIKYGAYLGTSSVTIEKHTIGENSIIGAGAVVATDIPDNVTAVGIPARVKEK